MPVTIYLVTIYLLARPHRLLCTIPGIGARTAAAILGEVPDASLYTSARSLAAHAGLTPAHRQSGARVGKTPMCKVGSSRLRGMLYMPALVALRYNPPIIAMATRLREAGKAPMQIVGAAMRRLLHIVYGVLKSGKPFDPALHTS